MILFTRDSEVCAEDNELGSNSCGKFGSSSDALSFGLSISEQPWSMWNKLKNFLKIFSLATHYYHFLKTKTRFSIHVCLLMCVRGGELVKPLDVWPSNPMYGSCFTHSGLIGRLTYMLWMYLPLRYHKNELILPWTYFANSRQKPRFFHYLRPT